MKFQVKRAPVEAVQWTGDNDAEVAEVMKAKCRRDDDKWLTVNVDGRLSDLVPVFINFWVIKDSHGDIRSMNPNSFKVLFEPAPEALKPNRT